MLLLHIVMLVLMTMALCRFIANCNTEKYAPAGDLVGIVIMIIAMVLDFVYIVIHIHGQQ